MLGENGEKIERKAKPIIANPKENIGGKAKKRRWSPNHNKWKHDIASKQDLLTTLKPREKDWTHQCHLPMKKCWDKCINKQKWGYTYCAHYSDCTVYTNLYIFLLVGWTNILKCFGFKILKIISQIWFLNSFIWDLKDTSH